MKLHITCIVLAFVAWLTGINVAQDRAVTDRPAEVVTGRIIAFLVGVTEYENSGDFPTLIYTVEDVKAWQKQLESIGAEPDHIVVMASNTSLSRRPTKQRFLFQLTELLKKVGKDDIIVCVFSGHGTQIGTESYFCPEDANADQLAESCVSLNDIMDKLEQSPAKFKWMIVDACRNDPSKSLPSGVKSLGKMESVPPGVATIFSCAATEKSYENVTLGHGVFTHFLLEGLAGKAADENGDVTIIKLFDYVQRETKMFVDRTYTQNQVPYMKGEFTNFVIHRVKPEVVPSGTHSTTQVPPIRTTSVGETVNYTLKLADVTLGHLPPGWNGPDNAVVNNVGGSKCVTNNTDRNPVELTLTGLFNQPGDFVLNFTCVARRGNDSTSGKIMDENGTAISFEISAGYGRVSFGDSTAKFLPPNNNIYSRTYTISRRGNIVSMTGEGVGGVMTKNSDTFGSMTGFTITIPGTRVGISHFTVHSLDGQSPQRPVENYTLNLSQVVLGDQPPGEWHGLDNAVVNNVGESKSMTSNTANPVELALIGLFNQPGDFVVNFTCVARRGSDSTTGKIMDENGNAISFEISAGYGRVSFGDSTAKFLPPNSIFYSISYTISRRGNIVSMTGEGVEGVMTKRSDTFKSLTGFTITIPNNNVGISQFSVRSLAGTNQDQ